MLVQNTQIYLIDFSDYKLPKNLSHLKNYVIQQAIMVYEKLFSNQLITILVTIPVFT